MTTDQKLINSIKAGGNSSLEVFYNKCFPMVASYIKQNTGNDEDAQDVFQEAIIVLIEKIKNTDFVLTSTLSTYVFAISKNIWLKNLRNNKLLKIEPLDDSLYNAEISTDENEEVDLEKRVSSWLSRITKHCQQILKALFFYNQPIEVLMVKMGWKNKHTAANQKYKCIQQLKNERKRDN